VENLGKYIRRQRIHQKRTLQEVADAIGVSKSFLSRIETGKVIPAVATISKIAAALQVSISSIIDDERPLDAVFIEREKMDKNLITTGRGYSMFPVASDYNHKRMQPVYYVVKRGEIKEDTLSHEGDEFILILEGETKFRVGNVEYTMKPGDCLYFNSIEQHGIEPITDEVRYMSVFV
jgi:transcriptional regulator with XRE-family HTH domain